MLNRKSNKLTSALWFAMMSSGMVGAANAANIDFNLEHTQAFFKAKSVNATGAGLVGIDAVGKIVPLATSELPTKVSYVTTHKASDKAYVALGLGMGKDGKNYSEIAQTSGCAIYQVDLQTHTNHCVIPNLVLRDVTDQQGDVYKAGINPIQFDAKGNAYFLAEDYTLRSYPVGAKHALYKFNPATGATHQIAATDNIIGFEVKANGTVAIESFNGQKGFINQQYADNKLTTIGTTFNKPQSKALYYAQKLGVSDLPAIQIGNKLYNRVKGKAGDRIAVVDLSNKQTSYIELDKKDARINDWTVVNGELSFSFADKSKKSFHGLVNPQSQKAFINILSTNSTQAVQL